MGMGAMGTNGEYDVGAGLTNMSCFFDSSSGFDSSAAWGRCIIRPVMGLRWRFCFPGMVVGLVVFDG